MTWLIVVGLAVAAFAVAASAFRAARTGWATFATALTLGLSGYALQASPGMRGAPASALAETDEPGWSIVDDRREMIGAADRSTSDKLIVADAFARRGRYADAATMLRGAVTDDPRDAEAWLALGNALVEHADGTLTEPALLAFRRAAELDPEATGPGYFLGFALIRQGRFGEGREVWAATLQTAGEDATGRIALEQRLARLDMLIEQLQRGRAEIPAPQ